MSERMWLTEQIEKARTERDQAMLDRDAYAEQADKLSARVTELEAALAFREAAVTGVAFMKDGKFLKTEDVMVDAETATLRARVDELEAALSDSEENIERCVQSIPHWIDISQGAAVLIARSVIAALGRRTNADDVPHAPSQSARGSVDRTPD